MIATIHQPAYLPWLGYLEKIMRSDIYVFLDAVQFEKNSYINRNRIKTSNGPVWLTVPVISKGHTGNTMMNLEIDERSRWQRKHWNAILLNYKHAPYFKSVIKAIEPFYQKKYMYLVDLCFEYTKFWLEYLNVNTEIVKFSEMGISTEKSQLVLDVCKLVGANTYISGALGRDYLDDKAFLKNGIQVIYQEYIPQVYPQLWGEFMPCMSVLDFVMNTRDYSLIKGV
ncbi:MAG: WbqC family protein [Selenomonadaceae bacterium]